MLSKYEAMRKTRLFFITSYLSLFLFSLFLYSGVLLPAWLYELVLKSLITSLFLWYLLYLSSIHRYLFYFTVVLLALSLTIKIYYSFILGVHIEPSVFEGMFDTNIDEVKRLGSGKPLYIFFSVLLFIAIISEFRWFKSFPLKKRVLFHFFKFALIVLLFIAYGVYTRNVNTKAIFTLAQEIFPVNFVTSFYEAAHAKYRLYRMNKHKIDIVRRYDFRLNPDDNVTIVFVRGESLRSRSFPITDKTVPPSVRIDDLNNSVLYKNVFSYANYTQAAVPWMLTRSIDNRLQNEKSLISVLTALGYDTTWVGCDHSNLANFATPIVNYALEAKRALFSGKLNMFIGENSEKASVRNILGSDVYDGRQFAYLLTQLKSNRNKKQFYWIEMNGSHVPWYPMVPRDFLYYRPYCDKSLDEIHECTEQEAENIYRNTILYTQYLLRKLIFALRDRNAVLFFASDHGESTGESGLYGHGFMLPKGKREIRDQINPAFMVWMSDRFRKNHRKEFDALQKNATKYMKHDVIFHSVLDICGVESSVIDHRKSIFSPEFIGRSKPVRYKIVSDHATVARDIDGSIIFQMDRKDPAPFYKSVVRLIFPETYRSIRLGICDLYQSSNYPGRVVLDIMHHGKSVYTRDIGDKKGVRKDFVTIDLKGEKEVRLILQAQQGIEKGWAWGDAARVRIDFFNQDAE